MQSKITIEDIKANIASEHYFTAEQGAWASGIHGLEPTKAFALPASLKLLTFCVLILRNGFIVTGESACVSAENFDAAIGRRLAREKAIEKVWMLMGYQLKSQIAERTAVTPAA